MLSHPYLHMGQLSLFAMYLSFHGRAEQDPDWTKSHLGDDEPVCLAHPV